MPQLLPVSLFGCFLVWIIYFVWYLNGKTRDSRNTSWWKNSSEDRDDLIYYDYHAQCTRYTKTGEKCVKLTGRDVNGDIYEYIATKPTIGVQRIKGIRYVNINRRNEEVKIPEEVLSKWRKNGNID